MANGELPREWERSRIRDRYRFTSKPRDLRLSKYPQVAFLPMDAIPTGRLFIREYLERVPGQISSGTYFEEGDLLLSKITPCFENGKQAIAQETPNGFGIATTEVIPLKAVAGISDISFLAYYLLDQEVRAGLASKMEGATGRQRLPKSVLEEWEMPFPPLPEQQTIAAVLSKLQRAVEAQDKIIATLKELKAATLAKLFREGLRGEPLKETEIGEIPESWEVSPIGNLLDIQLGKMLSPKARGGADPKPYLRNANVQWGRFDLVGVFRMDFSEREKQKFLLRKGDVLICEGGEPGRTAVWDMQIGECYYQKALHRLRPKGTNLIKPAFFSYWMDAAFRLFGVYGLSGTKTTIAHLPAIKLAALPIPRPSIEEQQEISCAISAVDRRLINAEQEHLKTTALFQSMLHLLMTGEVRIS